MRLYLCKILTRGIHRGGVLGYKRSPHTETPLNIVNDIRFHVQKDEDSEESFEWLSHCPPENRRIGDSLRMRPEILNDLETLEHFRERVKRYIKSGYVNKQDNKKSHVVMNAVALSGIIVELIPQVGTLAQQWLMSIMDLLLDFLKVLRTLPKTRLVTCRIAQTMLGIVRMLPISPEIVEHFYAADGRVIFVNLVPHVTSMYTEVDIYESILHSVVEVHPSRVAYRLEQRKLSDDSRHRFVQAQQAVD